MRRRVAAIAVLLAFSSCAAPTREEGVALNGSYISYESDGGPEPTLTIHAIVGNESCFTGHDLRLREDPTSLLVELVAHRRTDTKFCEAEGVLYADIVDLDEPLGTRTVFDATTGDPIAPRG